MIHDQMSSGLVKSESVGGPAIVSVRSSRFIQISVRD